MTRDFARRLLERVADAGTNGDPKCRACKGDGSVEVKGSGFVRCGCQDKIEEAGNLEASEARAGRPLYD